MTEFNDKNCFITGAASGIGRAFALGLANEGAKLFISDIDMENLSKVEEEIENIGVEVHADKCDVTKFSDLKRISEQFYSKLGDLDILINNAGRIIIGSLLDLEFEHWKNTFDVNLYGIVNSIKAFLPHLLEKRSGHIVNLASGAGVLGTFDPLPYIASKFGVVGISEALHGRLKKHGIKVSVIIPSYIRTNLFRHSKVIFPPKLVETEGEERLKKINDELMQEIAGKAKPPARVVKVYLKGIKNEELYIFDFKGQKALLTQKGSDPREYENFLATYFENSFNERKNHYQKYGINIEDYTYYWY